jgi:hypothetical protein
MGWAQPKAGDVTVEFIDAPLIYNALMRIRIRAAEPLYTGGFSNAWRRAGSEWSATRLNVPCNFADQMIDYEMAALGL